MIPILIACAIYFTAQTIVVAAKGMVALAIVSVCLAVGGGWAAARQWKRG